MYVGNKLEWGIADEFNSPIKLHFYLVHGLCMTSPTRETVLRMSDGVLAVGQVQPSIAVSLAIK